MSSVSAAAPSIIYLGMDVHKDSITIAVLPMGANAPTHVDRLPNELPKLKRVLERLARQGELRSCDEASGAAPRAARVGVRGRGDRAVAHPEAAGRSAEA